MTPELVIQLMRQALLTALWIAAPLLIVGFVAGIIVSLIQILTSIQDSAFNAIPRLLAFLTAFVFSMPWMLQKMTVYMTGILGTWAAMGIERLFDLPTVLGFLLTLARISGVFVFVPVPGLKSAVDPARILLTLGVALSLYPLWPHPAAGMSAGMFMLWLVAEAALGLGIGLAVSFAIEAFMVGAQTIGLQAGFSFASTIDPFSQADSGTLVIFSQTIAAALFFAMGLDREVVRVFARSMEICPPGTFTLSRHAAEAILIAGSTIFSTGLRLALPVVAVMTMVDISLALLGRVNAQLHLITIAFPVKIVVGLGLLAWIAVLLPAVLRSGTESAFTSLTPLLSR